MIILESLIEKRMAKSYSPLHAIAPGKWVAEKLHGWAIMAAVTSLKTPCWIMSNLPPVVSSAGVPRTVN